MKNDIISDKKDKTNNQKLFIGLLIGILIGSMFALYGLEFILRSSSSIIKLIIIFFLLAAALFIFTVILKDRIVKIIFGDVGDIDSFRSDAKIVITKSAETLSDFATQALPKKDQERIRWLAPKLINYLIWGRVRSWWFSVLISIFLAVGGVATRRCCMKI